MKRNYGIFTAVAMIIGIVIGSGIFFKSDNILIATQGNILLGAVVDVYKRQTGGCGVYRLCTAK